MRTCDALTFLMLFLPCVMPAFGAAGEGKTSLSIVRDGQATATIVLPANPVPEEESAAKELTTYVEKMSGARLPIVREGAQVAGVKVCVGRTKFVDGLGLNLEKLDWDGFVMKSVGDSLVLCGRNPHGTEFAVYRFLSKYGGVRWYIPTELGEHVPQRKDWSISTINDVEQPHFLSRQWSAVAPFDKGVWEKRNLMRARFAFHHNLLHVFTPDLYDKHPDWFPLRDGKRYQPKGADDHSWQPCMSNPEAAKFAAQAAAKAFEKNPSLVSFSLGINDSNGYCQCPNCQALVDPQKKFRDRPDYSDLVFTFMNRAAEELTKTHPDKYLGCLAYSWCESVPSFPVHPHIIPYLTNDRAQWLDAKFKANDMELIRRWSKASPNIAIYDYYYGSGYVIPRLFTRLVKESLLFAKNNNVKGFYGEIYSNWSLDGPKAWLASQLLWDADQDVNALLNDYYTHFFQESAAPMRQYFELCERQWMNQKGEARWFKYFFDAAQLELFPPEVCQQARRYLDEAARLAQSDLVKRRVKLYSEGFRMTELYATVYHGEAELSQLSLSSPWGERDGVRGLERLLRTLREFLSAQQELERYKKEVITPNDLHRPVIPFEERARYTPGTRLTAALAKIAEWGKRSGQWAQVKDALTAIAEQFKGSDVALSVKAHLIAQEHPEQLVEVIKNASFEETSVNEPPPSGIDWSSEGMPPSWSKWIRPGTTAQMVWTNQAARTGKLSLKTTGAMATTFLQSVPVQPGETYLASVFVKAKVSPRNKTQLLVQWQDAEGKWVTAPPAVDQLPAGETKDWTLLSTFFKIPNGVRRAVVCLTVYDQSKEDYAYFDDVSVRRVVVR